MLKGFRLTSLAVSLLFSTTVMAAATNDSKTLPTNYKDVPVTPAVCVQLLDGFYVGAQLGYDNYKVREIITAAPALLIGNLNGNPDLSLSGFVGGIFGGYGMYFFDRYYIGAELFFNDTNHTSQYNFTTAVGSVYSTKYGISESWGVSLLPGFKLNNATLAYFRLGFNRVSFRAQEWDTPAGTPTIYNNQPKWGSGFNYGLGLEHYLRHNLSLRMEYTHTTYSGLSTTATQYNPADNQFMLGLIYHFG